jgi:hypothetical protein
VRLTGKVLIGQRRYMGKSGSMLTGSEAGF